MFNIEQFLKSDPGNLTAIMAKNSLQTARKKPALDELKAQQQLARVVIEVITELESGTTQAMLKACIEENRYR